MHGLNHLTLNQLATAQSVKVKILNAQSAMALVKLKKLCVTHATHTHATVMLTMMLGRIPSMTRNSFLITLLAVLLAIPVAHLVIGLAYLLLLTITGGNR